MSNYISERRTVTFMPDASTGNPYQSLLASELTNRGIEVSYLPTKLFELFKYTIGKPKSVLHLHWADKYILSDSYLKTLCKVIAAIICLVMLRLRGVRHFYTFHNLTNHENRFIPLEKLFFFLYFKMVNTVFCHCEASQSSLKELYGNAVAKRSVITPHGHYIGSYPALSDQHETKINLDIPTDATVFLFFGQIRAYKGVTDLLKIFHGISDSNARLIIAGRIMSKDEVNVINDLAKQDSRVILRSGYVSDEDLSTLFSAADVFVSPFKDILTSGSIVLAASNGLPCIAPAIGCIPDTLPPSYNWLYDASDPFGIKNSLLAALSTKENLHGFGAQNLSHIKKKGDWREIAKVVSAEYGMEKD